ncbi:LLM class flavin-dependent oxidoreductase [Actinocorallia longicatena]|uniref:LLM class F420-dependent oxidoreductase n=1 Tax=Actinocorallia longicatena TaxID=111803 RepID=A0ABP6QFL4_9ACTN
MTAIRWGVNLPLPGAGRETIERLLDLGYSDVWTGEGGGTDAFTPLAAAAAWSPGLRLGTGVVPAQTRGTGVLAQTALSLAELSGAEVLLGIGSSVPAHVTALNGLPHVRPYDTVRDTLRSLRAALPPGAPVKLLVGALRPGMLRLSLREGDGAITNVLAAGDVPRIVEAAGPLGPGQELVVKIFVHPTEDAERARAAGRRFLGWILGQAPYRAFHEWLGRGDDIARHLTDDLVDELWPHGSPEELRDRIAAYVHPGVTSVYLHLAENPHVLPDLIPKEHA